MFECFEHHTFAALFEEVRNRSQLAPDHVKACLLSRTLESTQHVSVDLGFNIVECCTQNGQYSFLHWHWGRKCSSFVHWASARLPSKLLSPERYEGKRGALPLPCPPPRCVYSEAKADQKWVYQPASMQRGLSVLLWWYDHSRNKWYCTTTLPWVSGWMQWCSQHSYSSATKHSLLL